MPAVDYNKIRKAIANQVEQTLGVTCIFAEPELQNEPRPPRPYFSFKFLSPGIKQGDDAATWTGSGTLWSRGGQRKLVTDFNCYGRTHEEAYTLMADFQASLETESVQANLRSSGIAIWKNGDVLDLSVLLNTGFEGRCHLSVDFGVASNITEDMSQIQTINTTGVATSDQGVDNTIAVQVIAP